MDDPLLKIALEANRHGRLSVAIFGVAGLVPIAGGVVSHGNGGKWLVPVLLGVHVTGGANPDVVGIAPA